MPTSLQELQKKHNEAVEANRRKPVAVGSGRDKPADVVLEVVEGKHSMPGRNVSTEAGKVQLESGEVLWPGRRFVPSVGQMKDGKGGMLRGGKFRVVEGANAKTIARDSRKPMSTGADIGLRSLSTLKGEALKAALAAGLQVEDFEGIEPTGKFGRYTPEQVENIIGRKGGD